VIVGTGVGLVLVGVMNDRIVVGWHVGECVGWRGGEFVGHK
jgi:hypothetical protein